MPEQAPVAAHCIRYSVGRFTCVESRGKVCAIGGGKKSDKPAFLFKTSEFYFLFLSDERGYRPAPYFSFRGMKWMQWFDMPVTEDDGLEYYLKESCRIVSLGLTKKKQKELGLNQN